jgi:hypothetical protein
MNEDELNEHVINDDDEPSLGKFHMEDEEGNEVFGSPSEPPEEDEEDWEGRDIVHEDLP